MRVQPNFIKKKILGKIILKVILILIGTDWYYYYYFLNCDCHF